MKHKLLSSAMLFFIILLLPFSSAAQESQAAKDLAVREYLIGPRDLLEIKVFEFPELNQTVRVSQDGTITLPLLQTVQVGGLTKDAVEKKLALLLEEKYVKNAQVSVFIREYQSNRVAVTGAVSKPGMYELVGKVTLLRMISEAGGFTGNAADQLFVLREGNDGVQTSIRIDLDDLVMNGNQNLNIPLLPNDIVNVPPEKYFDVFVMGAVKTPGRLAVKESKGITLLQAIGQAGGPTEGASLSRVTIKSIDKNGKESRIKVNVKDIINMKKKDIYLKEGDVVYVAVKII